MKKIFPPLHQNKRDRQGRDVPQQPGVLLHRGQHQERGQGRLRDQLPVWGGVHQAGVRQGAEGSLRSGGGGSGRSSLGQTQQRRETQHRLEILFHFMKICISYHGTPFLNTVVLPEP